jgi:mono/diheme cytochrome c family protein
MKPVVLAHRQRKLRPCSSVLRQAALRLGCLLVVIAMMAGLSQTARADDDDGETGGAKFSQEAAATFNKRCTACHTYGKGTKVGPDLKGVNDRRKLEWLLKFIHGSSSVIKSGDPIATALFAQYKQQRMPDWTDLSDQQIKDILSYIKIGGPDIKPADERNAETATAAEVERGRQLFNGQARLKYGVQACVTCHSVQGEGMGGSLGPNLSNTYFKYQDRALAEFLRHPCFQFGAGAFEAHYLTPKESFALKAFLLKAALRQPARTAKNGDVHTTAEARPVASNPPQAMLSRISGQEGSKR